MRFFRGSGKDKHERQEAVKLINLMNKAFFEEEKKIPLTLIESVNIHSETQKR